MTKVRKKKDSIYYFIKNVRMPIPISDGVEFVRRFKNKVPTIWR